MTSVRHTYRTNPFASGLFGRSKRQVSGKMRGTGTSTPISGGGGKTDEWVNVFIVPAAVVCDCPIPSKSGAKEKPVVSYRISQVC
jgi:hypothetical protein